MQQDNRPEIAEALEGLAVHCRPPLMSVDDRSRWMADWCRDLARFPPESVRIACDRWRNGSDRKFPMPGQLIPLVKAVTLRPSDTGSAPKVWGPISDAEYDGLSIRDKARHQRLLAMDADRRAGPQWRAGQPVAPDDMPAEWRLLRNRAAGHRKEAQRLLEIVRERATA